MKGIKQKHEMLTYAISKDGCLVNVDEVKTGQECDCVCPACGESLVARNNGKIRKHHFAHKSGIECEFAHESMLHLLAKEKIQKAFLNADSFPIEYEYKSYCSNYDQCKYERYDECYSKERKLYNLKKYYDCCEQEVKYDGIKRRSDLKIYSSTLPEREPVYIEFCVTHASEQEKLHSGNRIIECIIESEEDINEIVRKGFIEDNLPIDDKMFLQTTLSKSKNKFYGFKNEDRTNNQVKSEIVFSRYVLYKSGKTRCYQDTCSCKNLKKSTPYSLYEMCFHTSVAFGIYEYAKYLGFKKYHIHNCLLCKNYVDSYSGIRKICRLYKQLQIPMYENFDTSRAKTCNYYTFNQEEYDQMMQDVCDIPHDEVF